MPRRPARKENSVPSKPAPPPTPPGRNYRWLGLSAALVAALVLLMTTHPWSSTAETPRPGQRDEFASDREGGAGGETAIAIDGKRTMEYLEAICKIGPRMSGTPGMKKQQELIEKHFK